MIREKVLWFFVLPVFILLFAGCEKDKVTAPFAVKTEINAKLLLYLEEEGDIINNILPPVIQAEEVFNNLNKYLVIDIRDNADFLAGHIGGAKNISKDSLYNYIRGNYISFSKVVLVSASGQSAAFYSALLRLAGFPNIFYLNYGMASWNSFFSSVWSSRLRTYPGMTVFSNEQNTKRGYSPLPELSLYRSGQSIKDFLQERTDILIRKGFNEDFNSELSDLAMTFDYWLDMNTKYYTVCIGPSMLYSSSPFTTNTYHLINAVLYKAPPDLSDFRSVTSLQTLPSDNLIAIYSGTGQESAFYTAYLSLLGYNAKSILFGVNNINYDMLFRSPLILPFAFKPEYIMNYPFITGPGGK